MGAIPFADELQTMRDAGEFLGGGQHGIQREAGCMTDGKGCQRVAHVMVAAQVNLRAAEQGGVGIARTEGEQSFVEVGAVQSFMERGERRQRITQRKLRLKIPSISWALQVTRRHHPDELVDPGFQVWFFQNVLQRPDDAGLAGTGSTIQNDDLSRVYH